MKLFFIVTVFVLPALARADVLCVDAHFKPRTSLRLSEKDQTFILQTDSGDLEEGEAAVHINGTSLTAEIKRQVGQGQIKADLSSEHDFGVSELSGSISYLPLYSCRNL